MIYCKLLGFIPLFAIFEQRYVCIHEVSPSASVPCKFHCTSQGCAGNTFPNGVLSSPSFTTKQTAGKSCRPPHSSYFRFFMRSSWYSRSRCSFSCSLFSRLRSKIKLWMAETRNVMLKQSNIVIDFHLSFLMRGNRPHLLYLQNHPQRGTCRQEVRRLQSSGDCSGRRQCPCCH